METSKRGQWGSSFGFLMAAIGSAIGLGNLWAFPYKMGKTGGFAFLILYLILVALVGVVGMLGEFALGRKTGKGAGGAYAALGKKYSFIGWMAVISPFLILSFYAVLGGMVLRYCLGFLVQIFGADGFAGQGSGFFGWLLYSGQSMILFFALFLVCRGASRSSARPSCRRWASSSSASSSSWPCSPVRWRATSSCSSRT